MIYTTHYHRSTFKHLSQNQIRESVTDPYTEPIKPRGHARFRRKLYSKLVSLAYPSDSHSLGLHAAPTLVYTRCVCVCVCTSVCVCVCIQAEPLSPDSQPHWDFQSQARKRLPTPLPVSRTPVILQLRGRAVRSGPIPFLLNSGTSGADVSLTTQRCCGLTPPSFNKTNKTELELQPATKVAAPRLNNNMQQNCTEYTGINIALLSCGPEKDNYQANWVKIGDE